MENPEAFAAAIPVAAEAAAPAAGESKAEEKEEEKEESDDDMVSQLGTRTVYSDGAIVQGFGLFD